MTIVVTDALKVNHSSNAALTSSSKQKWHPWISFVFNPGPAEPGYALSFQTM